jgi:glycerophosphoryl diester phosphodiesterase
MLGAGLLTPAAQEVPGPPAAPAAAPQVIGHAGSGFFTPMAPFNALPPSSLGAVRQALHRGAVGIEVDIQLSQDSVPILFHDVDLTNRTAAQGYISQYPAADLTKLPYRGGWPYDWFQNERIATLDELLTELSRRPEFPYLHLDLHEHDQAQPEEARYARSPALVRALGRVLRRHRVPAARVLVLTEHAPSLPQLRRELPGAVLGLEITDQFAERLALAVRSGVEAVVLSKQLTTPERVARAHARGLQVVVFGGRSRQSVQRLLGCRPDAIEVDNVPLMRRLLGQPDARPAEVPVAGGGAPNAAGMR